MYVSAHLFSALPRQGTAEMLRKGTNRFDQRLLHVFLETPCGEIDQHHEACLPLDQRTDRGLRLLPEDVISFPVAGDGTVLDLSANKQSRVAVSRSAR